MSRTIARPAPDEYAPYFLRYVDRVPGEDALTALESQIEETAALLGGLPEPQALHRYAPGKWSVKETVIHLADGERVFGYRALRFARADTTELPGFDENAWVPASGADARPIGQLVAELRAVRAATLAFARGCSPEALLRKGVANGHAMSARGLMWCIAGHELHHRGLLLERYGLAG